MCEGNTGHLLTAVDRVMDLLSRARDSLDWDNSVAELVEAGHAARTRYERFPRSDIFTVVIGADKWREELAAAGRAGGVIRSALPIRDSPR
jgi:prephenate dehydrogenase